MFLWLRSTWTVRSQVGTPPFQMQMFTLYWRPSKILLAAECNIDQYSPPLMAPITMDSRYLCEELKRLMTHSDEFFKNKHTWKSLKGLFHWPLGPTSYTVNLKKLANSSLKHDSKNHHLSKINENLGTYRRSVRSENPDHQFIYS